LRTPVARLCAVIHWQERSVISDSKSPLKGNPSEVVAQLAGGGAGNTSAAVDPRPVPRPRTSTAQLWLHRILVLLFVFLCAVVGVLLVILPWHPEWSDNPLLLRYPGLRSLLSNNFVRGICSGLGLLDIWIGFWEAVHYREDPRV
jgi:hypothetical protein